MPQVKVNVLCNCKDVDGEEIPGADSIFENKDERTQSRIYTCPWCNRSVTVILDFRGN